MIDGGAFPCVGYAIKLRRDVAVGYGVYPYSVFAVIQSAGLTHRVHPEISSVRQRAKKGRCWRTCTACQQRPWSHRSEPLVSGLFDMVAGVFDIPAGTADGVAATCAEEGNECGCKKQQD